jgi:hypothetical protein
MKSEELAMSESVSGKTPADGERPAAYQRTGAPGKGSPEYEAMDQLAKLFEAQVEELRGDEAPKQH